MTTIIAATNRENSYTLKLAYYYQKLLREYEVEADVLSLTTLPDTFIRTDMYGNRSPEFQVILDRVNATTKFVFIAPEYNGSFPGILKTFIDGCKYPDSFYDKRVALVGLSDGKYGNIRGIEHLTGICHYIGLHVLPLRIHITYIKQDMNAEGDLTREDTIKYVRQQVGRFVGF
jgi:NAD(P)H-dependent FMN reductase